MSRALPDRKLQSALIAPVFGAWIWLGARERYGFVSAVTSIATHGGSLLCALAVFALCLRPAQRMRPILGGVAVATLSMLAGGSDALFIVSCSVPLAATVLVYAPFAIVRRGSIGAWPRLLLVRCALGAAFGPLGFWLSQNFGLTHMPNVNTEGGSWALAEVTWARVVNDPDKLSLHTLVALAVLAFVALVVIVATWRNPRRAGLRVIAFWQIAVSGAVAYAYLYTGAHFDRWTLRYLVTPCNLSVVFLTALAVWPLRGESVVGTPSPWPTRIAAATTLLLFVSFATQASGLLNIPASSRQRAAAQCIAELAEREQVTAVMGEYWVVKPIVLFSDHRAHMVQITPSLQPNHWIVSRGWFRAPLNFGMIVTNGLDTQRLEKVFGPPQYSAQCDPYVVWVYQGKSRLAMAFRMQHAFDTSLIFGDQDRKIGWRASK